MSVTAAHRKTGIATDKENRERDDFYPTPPEAVHALLDRVSFNGPIWEPACGDGAICRVLENRGHSVIATDLIQRGYGQPGIDFLMEWRSLAPNIITNPPYKHTLAFMQKAVALASGKVALLLRLACLEGQERGMFYEDHPPSLVLVFSGRLTMWRNGVAKTDSGGTTAFAWFIWDKADKSGETKLGWI